ncbi:glycoside hydrolase family 92 protein [Phanerochaete carnosa HHB-10118-sp]|uniref:Glycoside hydrolase family 92 protein n=1 Tax=Phanerochaete carnosa (strain HHB-10118-sp) TaxID=650164 RepID=K5VRS2_PHACS|nr:glycoside hydrolase family 92 protein [Phanerochaete carnosa HHB-10118-sp]EKM54203.1 glycoside hydrolase family 92 protein [Phanerochaete carnosa HHB-10118-sp]
MAPSPQLLALAVLLLSAFTSVWAQPSPQVQKGISQAIKNAANATGNIDYTQFVNVFIGTDNDGDVCPGASIPFGMVKFTTDLTGYAPAGYITDNTQTVRGMSPLHDSGTGSSSGSYGNFEVMPLTCPGGFDTCTTSLEARERFRKNNTDDASPGYFALTLDNDIKLEATSTRRAGLERFTYPKNSKPYLVLDLANDLPASFAGGTMNIDPEQGRIIMGGLWGSSFGPGEFNYEAFACFDLLNGGNQTLDEYGVWTADTNGLDAKGLGLTQLNFTRNLIGGVYQSGALVSFQGTPETITIRVGVSFVSADQACANAESEVGDSSFEDIVAQSVALWNEKLSKIEIDLAHTPPNVTEMFYSSLYRAFLTPNNATGETQGPFAGTTHHYFDSLYCSWDTFRTFYPLMALTSPVEFSQIVDNYLDAWRVLGWMPECRANHLPGWTQGGSSGDVIVGHFAMTYHDEAAALGINLNDIYSAQLADAQLTPPNWDIEGREAGAYIKYGYVPASVLETDSVGRQTREGSRTLEYAFEDFAIRNVALLLNKTEDFETFNNRSQSYRSVWDSNVKSDSFAGFMQKRFPNGTFLYTNPVDCSPIDNSSRSCSLQDDNTVGFYESSSWEYSWFVPHDTAHLIELMGGNETFVNRLDHFFEKGYYYAGNEPSFQTPIGYHYANHPTQSVDRVRDVVFTNFDITPAGIPGNDDQAAMATLLAFHLLGLYPVPGSTELLVVSPFIPQYTVHNSYLNVSTTVTTKGFDARSVQQTIPKGAAAYVANVTINNQLLASRCHLDFYDIFKTGGDIVIEVTADKNSVDNCGASLPMSVSTGGFNVAR